MNYLNALSLCVLMLSGMLFAKQNLWVENTTQNRVNLVFSTEGSQSVTLPVFAGKKQVIIDLENLTELYLESTGLIGVLSRKHNLVDELNAALRSHPSQDMSLTIGPSSWADLTPFTSSFKVYTQELLEHSTAVMRYFPEVVLAIEEKRELKPQYFLGLRENASREELKRSYQSQGLYLKSLLESKLPKTSAQTEYYEKALMFVQAAYNGIIGGNTEPLQDLITAERESKRAALLRRLFSGEIDEEERARNVRIAQMRALVKDIDYSYATGTSAMDTDSDSITRQRDNGRRGFDKFNRAPRQ